MKKGFTIIELIFVLIIMGILGGIGYKSYSSAIKSSKITTLVAQLNKLDVAIQNYYADTGTYPANISYLWANPSTRTDGGIKGEAGSTNRDTIYDALGASANGEQDIDVLSYWGGPYLQEVKQVEGNPNVLKPEYGTSMNICVKIEGNKIVPVASGDSITTDNTYCNVIAVRGLEPEAVRIAFKAVNGQELDNFIAETSKKGSSGGFTGNALDVIHGRTSMKLGIGSFSNTNDNVIIYRYTGNFQGDNGGGA